LLIPETGVAMIDFEALAWKAGAVAVAAIAGAILAQLLLWLVWRMVTRRKTPAGLRSVASLTGAVVGGLAVLLLLLNLGGGPGWGGVGGWLPFAGGGGKNGSTGSDQPPASSPERPMQTVEVRMLGGTRVVDQRFYVIPGEMPRNWDELAQALDERRRQHPELKEIEIVIYLDSVDQDSPAVTALVDWARKNGLEPKLPLPQTKMP
jgi:hypothetical protein